MTGQIHSTIQKMIDATNAGDTQGFLNTFAEDASISDWGRSYRGRTQIANWNETDNIGVKSKLRVVRCVQSENLFRLTVEVTGDGFNGEGTMAIRIERDMIAELAID